MPARPTSTTPEPGRVVSPAMAMAAVDRPHGWMAARRPEHAAPWPEQDIDVAKAAWDARMSHRAVRTRSRSKGIEERARRFESHSASPSSAPASRSGSFSTLMGLRRSSSTAQAELAAGKRLICRNDDSWRGRSAESRPESALSGVGVGVGGRGASVGRVDKSSWEDKIHGERHSDQRKSRRDQHDIRVDGRQPSQGIEMAQAQSEGQNWSLSEAAERQIAREEADRRSQSHEESAAAKRKEAEQRRKDVYGQAQLKHGRDAEHYATIYAGSSRIYQPPKVTPAYKNMSKEQILREWHRQQVAEEVPPRVRPSLVRRGVRRDVALHADVLACLPLIDGGVEMQGECFGSRSSAFLTPGPPTYFSVLPHPKTLFSFVDSPPLSSRPRDGYDGYGGAYGGGRGKSGSL